MKNFTKLCLRLFSESRGEPKVPYADAEDGANGGEEFTAPCDLIAEEEELRQRYPEFDAEEVARSEKGPEFVDMLKRGVSMRAAYEATHMDELIEQAVLATAKSVREKTVNDIRSRGLRPVENGAGAAAAPPETSYSKDQLDAIIRRARRGERVVL